MAGWPHGYAPHLIVPTGSPSDGDTLVWDAASSQWRPGAGAGGGASTPPGQAAHYIGTWDVAVAYAAGECVRQWDGSEFKLYQAKKATTGDDPTSVVASWAEVTTPIVMWGTENPVITDLANPNGGGISAPGGSIFSVVDGANVLLGRFVSEDRFTGNWIPATFINLEADPVYGGWSASSAVFVDGAADGLAINTVSSERAGAGGGDGLAALRAFKSDAGIGNAHADVLAYQAGGTGNARVTLTGEIDAAATGTATCAVSALYDPTSAEAHVIPTANATRAWNDVKGDLEFTDNTEGPVIHDQSDGHTYRIVSTAGVLSTVQVT